MTPKIPPKAPATGMEMSLMSVAIPSVSPAADTLMINSTANSTKPVMAPNSAPFTRIIRAVISPPKKAPTEAAVVASGVTAD